MLGITEEYEHFDQDIIMHINAAFMILTQIGVGDPNGFSISDKTTTWGDFLTTEEDFKKAGSLQSYVFIKVKLGFDPPQNSFTIESYNKIASEYEWRMNVAFDSGASNAIDVDDSIDDIL